MKDFEECIETLVPIKVCKKVHSKTRFSGSTKSHFLIADLLATTDRELLSKIK